MQHLACLFCARTAVCWVWTGAWSAVLGCGVEHAAVSTPGSLGTRCRRRALERHGFNGFRAVSGLQQHWAEGQHPHAPSTQAGICFLHRGAFLISWSFLVTRQTGALPCEMASSAPACSLLRGFLCAPVEKVLGASLGYTRPDAPSYTALRRKHGPGMKKVKSRAGMRA